MFVKGFFTRYWRYLLALICGCAVITTGPACSTRGGRDGGGSPLLIITSIAASNISSVGATISWSTNRPADSQVEYGVTTGYGNVMSLRTMDTSHQLNLFGLTPDTLYHYRVRSRDDAGNLSTSGDLTFTTARSGSPTISSFTASPGSIMRGQSSVLSWSVTGATSLILDPGNVTVTGLTSRQVAPTTTTTYVLTATNSAGAVTRSVTVTVTGAPAPTPTPFPIGGVDEFVGPFPSWTNVKTAYGASGNGATDDTAALQRGMDDLSSGAIKTLYLPAGTYRITQTLRLHNTIYVNFIGEDPDFTTIRWDGASGGIMMEIDGVAYSRYNRLTFDGQGSAKVAVDQSKRDGSTPHFDTGNEYAEDVFKNVGYGIRAGNNDYGAAETSVVRSRFINNTIAGIATKNFNALDWWIWFCYFENCATGVTNAAENDGAGNFSVYNSVFKGSTVADMSIAQVQSASIRYNYSIGSKLFYISLGAGINGAMTAIQGNTILDTKDPSAIVIRDYGPVNIYDNFIRSAAGSAGPAIRIDVADTLAFDNTFTISNQLRADGRFIADGNKAGSITASEPVIPFKYVPATPKRQIFEVPVGANSAAIQQRIDSAKAFCGQRPIVHFPASSAEFRIDNTLVVPANCDIQLVGDGGYSSLIWAGSGIGPVITLQGPSRAILRDLRVGGASEGDVNGIVIENADQPNSRVYMQEAFANTSSQNGLFVDGLSSTRVDLRGFLHMGSSGSGIKVTGGVVDLGGRTILMSGASSSNTLTYEVTGGRLVAKDVWYETGGTRPGYMKLTGSPIVTLDQGKVFTIPVNTTPPSIDIRDFNGKATFVGLDLEDRINISGASNGTILALGLQGHSANYFFDNTPADARLINSRWYDKTSGTITVTNIGSADVTFLRDMLAQTRGANLSNEYELFPAGITDVRMFRVYAERTIVGFHIKR